MRVKIDGTIDQDQCQCQGVEKGETRQEPMRSGKVGCGQGLGLRLASKWRSWKRLKRLPQQNNEPKFLLKTYDPPRFIAGRFEYTVQYRHVDRPIALD